MGLSRYRPQSPARWVLPLALCVVLVVLLVIWRSGLDAPIQVAIGPETQDGALRSDITGQWEVRRGDLCSAVGLEPGTVVEFFGDGSISLGAYASSYTWANSSHLRIEMAPGVHGCVLGVSSDGSVMRLMGEGDDPFDPAGAAGSTTLVRP